MATPPVPTAPPARQLTAAQLAEELFESQGSFMMRLAVGSAVGAPPHAAANTSADSTTSSASEIRLRQVRETQLEEFPTSESIQLDLSAFAAGTESYASPPRLPREPTTVAAAPASGAPGILPPVGAEEAGEAVSRRVTDAQAPSVVTAPPPISPSPHKVEDKPEANKPPMSFASDQTEPGDRADFGAAARARALQGTRHPRGGKTISSLDDENFAPRQQPRSKEEFSNLLTIRARTEEEAERSKARTATIAGPSRATRAPHKRSISRENQTPISVQDKARVIDSEEDSSHRDDSSSMESHGADESCAPAPHARIPLGPTRILADLQPTVLVAATPTDTDTSHIHSSGISNPAVSQPPIPLVSSRSDPTNPPFERPTSSLASSSRPYTEQSHAVSDQSVPRRPVSPASSSSEVGYLAPAPGIPPATPERVPSGPPSSPANPVTPTQPLVAPAPRLVARQVDPDTLSRLRSSTGSLVSVVSFKSDRQEKMAVDTVNVPKESDDGVEVDLLLPSVNIGTPDGSAVAQSARKPPPTTPSRIAKRKLGEIHDTNDISAVSPATAGRSGNRKRARRGSPVRSSPRVASADRTTKAAAMKTKTPISPIKYSSPDVPLASLPNVTKGRGRRSSVRTRGPTKRVATPESEADSSGQEEPSDMAEDEAEVSQAIREVSDSEAPTEKLHQSDVEMETASSSDEHDDEVESSSSEEDNEDDEDYRETQDTQPPTGPTDQFGIQRKGRTFASVSPAKSSRKRARAAARARDASTVSPTKSKKPRLATVENDPDEDVLRVLAPWHQDGQLYMGSIFAPAKDHKYTVVFDDGEQSKVPLSKLRTPVLAGDQVKILKHENQPTRWGTVTSTSWDNGTELITMSLGKRGGTVTVHSRYIVVPKDTFPPDRHVRVEDIPDFGGINLPSSSLRPRSKSIASARSTRRMSTLGPSKPSAKGKGRASSKFVATEQIPISSSSRLSNDGRNPSVLSYAETETYPPFTGTVLPTQLRNAFANTMIILSGVRDETKSSLVPRIRRGAGKLVEEWTDILSFGAGREDIRWKKGVAGDEKKQVLLLSKDPTFSLKYMMALALGVPCVHVNWATDRAEGVDVPWSGYLLGAGVSERLKQTVSQLYDPRWAEGMLTSGSLLPGDRVRQPFDGLAMLMIFSHKEKDKATRNHHQEAQHVICAAGARSVELIMSNQKPKEHVASYDFVVTDLTNAALVRQVLESGAKKCVGTDWVRQCIVNGGLQPLPLI